MRTETKIVDGKTIRVYFAEKEDAPVVYSCDFSDNAEDVLAACSRIGCPAFHLVSIMDIRWDEELSPWPHEPVVSKDDRFAGEADDFLATLESEIVPYADGLAPNSHKRILNGYSMGGLFALYAAHKSELFDAYSAPSASVWYPDFTDFVGTHAFCRKPNAIYLSLGDRESRTKNPYLSQTEPNMRALETRYLAEGIASVFELNWGNHFQHVSERIAKGLNWTLEVLKDQKRN